MLGRDGSFFLSRKHRFLHEKTVFPALEKRIYAMFESNPIQLL